MLIDRSPVTHLADGEVGVLVVHGFSGNPFSVRGVADAMIHAGHDVEAPCLPGHGTTVDELVDTRWHDWLEEVGAAADRLAARCHRVVAIGQSMGGALVLAQAFTRPEIAGLVCINPVTRQQDVAVMEMLEEFIADGLVSIPGGDRSDIADPDGFDDAYDETPLRPVVSALRDGIGPMTDRFGELSMPLLLITSRQDHVVPPADSEHLAATYGGPVDHLWLERSFHVATRDLERELVEAAAVEFVERHAVVPT